MRFIAALIQCVLFGVVAKSVKLTNKSRVDSADVNVGRRLKRAVTADSTKLWPNATVLYKFDSQLSAYLQELLLNAIDHWQNNTCIRFREKTKHDADFVFFTSTSCGCCSAIGRVGGKQNLSLKNYCATQGVAIHELGHVVGFWHEHTRPDRDRAVKVLWDNIQIDQYDNFVKRQYIEIQSFGRPYDFSSIMHYGPGTFSNGKGPTMVAKDKTNKVIRQATVLSQEDILQANLLYNCPGDDCNFLLDGRSFGEILSPYYPNNYTPDLDCEWIIQVPKGKYIELSFNELSLQDSYRCSADHLTIKVNSENGSFICTLCGSALPPAIVSTTSLWLKLHSNWMLEKRGFNISYEIRDILPLDILRLNRQPEDTIWKNADCTRVSRLKHGVYRSAEIPSNGEINTDTVCSFIADGSQYSDARRIKLEMTTRQMRAYGENCLGYVFVPISSNKSKYIGTFESSSDDEHLLDPNLWRPLHYTCKGSDHLVELTLNETIAVIIWSSAYHKALNLSYWIDLDECLIDAPCDHICNNTLKGFNCSCYEGFQLTNTHKCVEKKLEIANKCHQQLTAPVGKIISTTEPHALCSYDIVRPEHKITLVFKRLHFAYPGECSLNAINVTSNKHLIAHLCTDATGVELTAGESITLLQSTNVSSGVLPFFIAQYSSSLKREEECEYSVFGAAVVASPRYPHHYQPNIDCAWKLSVAKGKHIALTIIDVDIEYTKECAFDSLTVYDGRNRKSPVLLTVCGLAGNTTIHSSGNRLTLRLLSDSSGAGRGFKVSLTEAANSGV